MRLELLMILSNVMHLIENKELVEYWLRGRTATLKMLDACVLC